MPLTARWFAVLALAVSLLVWLAFQTVQLSLEREKLRAIQTNQEPIILQAHRVMAQHEGIANGTLQLARQGNVGAATVVEQFARRGIVIRPRGLTSGVTRTNE